MQTAPKPRAARGTVTVEQKQGKLRIRLPRTVAKDSQRYISTRLDPTEENLKKVQRVAWEIEEDIKLGCLDPTLEKYHQQFRPKLTIVKSTLTVDLGELWDKYCEYRKPQVAETTYKKEYLLKYANHIKELPIKDLSRAAEIRNHIVSKLTSGSARRLLTQISACCKWAVSSGLIKENPLMGMSEEIKVTFKNTDTIDPFNAKERDAILEAFFTHPRYNHYYPNGTKKSSKLCSRGITAIHAESLRRVGAFARLLQVVWNGWYKDAGVVQKLFVSRKSLLVHEILSLIRIS